MLHTHKTSHDKLSHKIMSELGESETAISKLILSQLLVQILLIVTDKRIIFFRKNIANVWPIIVENHIEYSKHFNLNFENKT